MVLACSQLSDFKWFWLVDDYEFVGVYFGIFKKNKGLISFWLFNYRVLAFYFRIKHFWNQNLMIYKNIANLINRFKKLYNFILVLIRLDPLFNSLKTIRGLNQCFWILWVLCSTILNKRFRICFATNRNFSYWHRLKHFWNLLKEIARGVDALSLAVVMLMLFVAVLL